VRGEFELGGRKVNLKNVTMPVMNIYALQDHLVPPAASRPFTKLIGSKDKEEIPFPGGHIGIYVSSKSQNELAPRIAEWLNDHCDMKPAKPAPRRKPKPAKDT
jgi:polyhydroxyalkanoate synthase